MGIIHPEDGEFATELRKWNLSKRQGGMGPDGHEEFPHMVYKAFPYKGGKVQCGDMGVVTGDPEAMAFASKCQLTVRNPEELARATADGWADSPDDAIAAYEGVQKTIGDAAAERAFADQRLSDRAKAEAKAADEATHEHVADVPAPKKRPYRKKVKTEE